MNAQSEDTEVCTQVMAETSTCFSKNLFFKIFSNINLFLLFFLMSTNKNLKKKLHYVYYQNAPIVVKNM